MHDTNFQQAEEIAQKANGGIITLPQSPSLDAIAAATALHLGLIKLGKHFSVTCATPVKAQLHAADKINTSFATNGNNLVVSFPYSEGAIDKVDYKIDDGFFHLIVSSRSAKEKLNPKDVSYSYSGGTVDCIIVIDAPTPQHLGSLYTANQNQFQTAPVINIDRHLTNAFFGTANIVEKTISSISELAFQFLETLSIEIDKEIATNLYAGIASATNNFSSYSVNANTFETAAKLLKLGALKKVPVSSSFKAPQKIEKDADKKIESVEQEPEIEERIEEEIMRGETTTPEDWLKPKIFHSGDLV